MKIVFKTREEKRKEYNKKKYVWKRKFLFIPSFCWFVQYKQFPEADIIKRSFLWLCFMEKRSFKNSDYPMQKIVHYRECGMGDEKMRELGFYRNLHY
jgi:hypothetical protein